MANTAWTHGPGLLGLRDQKTAPALDFRRVRCNRNPQQPACAPKYPASPTTTPSTRAGAAAATCTHLVSPWEKSRECIRYDLASGMWGVDAVVEGFRGLKFSRASAWGVFDYLWGDQYGMDHDYSDDEASPRVRFLEVTNEFDSDIHAIDECEDDRIGFCEVDFVLELLNIEDEDRFLVEEI